MGITDLVRTSGYVTRFFLPSTWKDRRVILGAVGGAVLVCYFWRRVPKPLPPPQETDGVKILLRSIDQKLRACREKRVIKNEGLGVSFLPMWQRKLELEIAQLYIDPRFQDYDFEVIHCWHNKLTLLDVYSGNIQNVSEKFRNILMDLKETVWFLQT